MSESLLISNTDFASRQNYTERLVSNGAGEPELALELNVPYTVFEILVAVFAVVGNLMVIIVFKRERKLRRRNNYYIVSLAIADFLVGALGIPFAILASIGLPANLYACLFTVSLLIVLCTTSIFCLFAVSVDRYWAIVFPMAYSRNVRTRTTIIIISLCWLIGFVVGFLPLFGWHADVGIDQACLFSVIIDYHYLVFVHFGVIVTPALLMLFIYVHIYRIIVCSVFGAVREREVKATKTLTIIVLFFMICWIPMYTVNCIQGLCKTCKIPEKLTLFCIILSHLHSAVNPVLYAYRLRDFRAALKNLILCVMGVGAGSTNIDSPFWLRQQQANARINMYEVISPCLNNLNRTVGAVTSTTSLSSTSSIASGEVPREQPPTQQRAV